MFFSNCLIISPVFLFVNPFCGKRFAFFSKKAEKIEQKREKSEKKQRLLSVFCLQRFDDRGGLYERTKEMDTGGFAQAGILRSFASFAGRADGLCRDLPKSHHGMDQNCSFCRQLRDSTSCACRAGNRGFSPVLGFYHLDLPAPRGTSLSAFSFSNEVKATAKASYANGGADPF